MEFWLFLFIIYSLIVKGSLNLQDNSGQYVQHTLDPWNGIKIGGKGAPMGRGWATEVRKMPLRWGRVKGGKEEEKEGGGGVGGEGAPKPGSVLCRLGQVELHTEKINREIPPSACSFFWGGCPAPPCSGLHWSPGINRNAPIKPGGKGRGVASRGELVGESP